MSNAKIKNFTVSIYRNKRIIIKSFVAILWLYYMRMRCYSSKCLLEKAFKLIISEVNYSVEYNTKLIFHVFKIVCLRFKALKVSPFINKLASVLNMQVIFLLYSWRADLSSRYSALHSAASSSSVKNEFHVVLLSFSPGLLF